MAGSNKLKKEQALTAGRAPEEAGNPDTPDRAAPSAAQGGIMKSEPSAAQGKPGKGFTGTSNAGSSEGPAGGRRANTMGGEGGNGQGG